MKKLTEIISNIEPSVQRGSIVKYGDIHDGVIEFPAIFGNNEFAEVGYFYGDLKPKNIVAISLQIGCPSNCKFCELGTEPFIRNLTGIEMYDQVVSMLQLASEFGIDIDKSPHKVNIAKSGEPLLNNNIIEGLELISNLNFTFKVSTVFPNCGSAQDNLKNIAKFASTYNEPIQMQISLISTSQEYRKMITGIDIAPFDVIRNHAEYWKCLNPFARKFNLSLIVSEETPCEVSQIEKILTTDLFRVRLRPYITTETGEKNNLRPITYDRFCRIFSEFANAGYEVGDWAIPTETERKWGLVANKTLRRYLNDIRTR